MTATYSQPSAASTALVSVTHLLLGRSAENSRFSTLGAKRACLSLLVVGFRDRFESIQIYAGIVATGVAEEKSSRMMEILVNAATPFQLLAGKIVGIGVACLTQMGGLVVVGIAGLLLQTPVQAALFGAHAGSFSQYLTGVSIPFYPRHAQ
jgi:hypothetical protein